MYTSGKEKVVSRRMNLRCSSPDAGMLKSRTNEIHSGVAVGSSIGHAVGSLFTGGGSSSAPAEAQQAPAAPAAQPMDNGLYQSQSWGETPACENDVRAFRKCMDENSGNMSICGWYLDQLVCVFDDGDPEGREMMLMGFYRKLASRLLSSTKPESTTLDFPG